MRLHTGIKPFACSHCDKQFVTKGDLNIHLRKYTKEASYECSLCSKRCSRKGDLKLHMRIWHSYVEIKTESTGQSQGTMYCCDSCDKIFASREALHKHVKIHMKDARYFCTLCSHQFLNSSHFKRHMATHTGEKPYVCGQCDKNSRTLLI